MSFDLDAALEALARRIDRVESDRVARMAELERAVNERLIQDAKAAVKRIETLERGEKELYARCQEVAGAALAALQDRDRQDRWHATRDAALNGYVHAGVTAEYSRDEVLKWANDFADRAHGPLEARATGDGWDPNSFATVRSYTSYGQATHWVKLEEVNALVKAAKRHLCGHTRGHHRNECGCTTCELAGAVEPFETERSE